MTLSELYNLIQTDTQATTFTTIGDDTSCASRINEIAPFINKPVQAGAIKELAAKTGVWATLSLAKDKVELSDSIRGICITFLDWVNSGYKLDFELPEVQGMIDALVSSTLVTAEQAATFKAMGQVRDVVSANDVSEAMYPHRIDGRI